MKKFFNMIIFLFLGIIMMANTGPPVKENLSQDINKFVSYDQVDQVETVEINTVLNVEFGEYFVSDELICPMERQELIRDLNLYKYEVLKTNDNISLKSLNSNSAVSPKEWRETTNSYAFQLQVTNKELILKSNNLESIEKTDQLKFLIKDGTMLKSKNSGLNIHYISLGYGAWSYNSYQNKIYKIKFREL